MTLSFSTQCSVTSDSESNIASPTWRYSTIILLFVSACGLSSFDSCNLSNIVRCLSLMLACCLETIIRATVTNLKRRCATWHLMDSDAWVSWLFQFFVSGPGWLGRLLGLFLVCWFFRGSRWWLGCWLLLLFGWLLTVQIVVSGSPWRLGCCLLLFDWSVSIIPSKAKVTLPAWSLVQFNWGVCLLEIHFQIYIFKYYIIPLSLLRW